MHPDLEPIAFLLGAWRGEGLGAFPTSKPFEYGEEVRFWHVGGPFLSYAQRAWAPDDETTLHSESGFWRPSGAGGIEVALAHPLGLVEVTEGTVSGTTIRLASTLVGRTSTGKPVTRLERRYELDGDALAYELWMATDEVLLSRHLSGSLRRVSA